MKILAQPEIMSRNCVFGTMSGRKVDPILVITEPFDAVLRAKPHLGQARSFTSRGFTVLKNVSPGTSNPAHPSQPLRQGLPISNMSPHSPPGGEGFHVERLPGAKVTRGLIKTGFIVEHMSLAPAVPSIWRYTDGEVLVDVSATFVYFGELLRRTR